MRKVLISLALVSASLTAIPAAAQGYYGGVSNRDYASRSVHREIQRDIQQLENRIDRSARRGRISRREAISLRREAVQVRQLHYRYARNGLDRSEARNLAIRLDRLQQRVRYERNDADGRRY